jgi:hypothetical protein
MHSGSGSGFGSGSDINVTQKNKIKKLDGNFLGKNAASKFYIKAKRFCTNKKNSQIWSLSDSDVDPEPEPISKL